MREELRELGQTNVIVRQALDAHRYGGMSYVECLEAAVVALCESESKARAALFDVYARTPVVPTFLPAQDYLRSEHKGG